MTSGHDGSEAQHILEGGHREAGTHGLREPYYYVHTLGTALMRPTGSSNLPTLHPARIYQTCMKCHVWCYKRGLTATIRDYSISAYVCAGRRFFPCLGKGMRGDQLSNHCLQRLTQQTSFLGGRFLQCRCRRGMILNNDAVLQAMAAPLFLLHSLLNAVADSRKSNRVPPFTRPQTTEPDIVGRIFRY